MKAVQAVRRSAALGAVALFALLALAAGCAVEGGYAYPYDVPVGVGVGYQESFGFDYGGFGPGYYVGPPRGGMSRGVDAPGRRFRPAPSGRAMPSIPTAPRRGGGRPGGRGR